MAAGIRPVPEELRDPGLDPTRLGPHALLLQFPVDEFVPLRPGHLFELFGSDERPAKHIHGDPPRGVGLGGVYSRKNDFRNSPGSTLPNEWQRPVFRFTNVTSSGENKSGSI